MAIVNRDKDASEQKMHVSWFGNSLAIQTGASLMLGQVPTAGTLQSIHVAALGLSGNPQLNFRVNRFAGTAMTSIPVSISNLVVTALGTSGSIGYSGLAAAGSTLLQLQSGDVLTMHTAGANTAAEQLLVDIVIKKTQDIVAEYGVSL